MRDSLAQYSFDGRTVARNKPLVDSRREALPWPDADTINDDIADEEDRAGFGSPDRW